MSIRDVLVLSKPLSLELKIRLFEATLKNTSYAFCNNGFSSKFYRETNWERDSDNGVCCKVSIAR